METIFQIREFGSWLGYVVSDKPYYYGGIRVTEFNDFID